MMKKEIDSNNEKIDEINSEDNNNNKRRKSTRKSIPKSFYTNSSNNNENLSDQESHNIVSTTSENHNNITSNNCNEKQYKESTDEENVGQCTSTEFNCVNNSTNHTNGNSSSKVKSSRKWELWTEDDTKLFFNALAEHGKDFHSIQTYMKNHSDKKSELIKNREQVRHYYYRMWHKIIGLGLHISDDIDKQTQELYGLINYGELWKKFGAKTDTKVRIKQQLNELVFKGHTTIKVKGKVIKIKTPICKALKKINKIDEPIVNPQCNSVISLPNEVNIELHPKSNTAWLKVHCLAQNPRVKTKLSLQKRLSTLICYLEKRWSKSRVRETQKLYLLENNMNGEEFEKSKSDEKKMRFYIKPSKCMLENLYELKIGKAPGGYTPSVTLNDISLKGYLSKFCSPSSQPSFSSRNNQPSCSSTRKNSSSIENVAATVKKIKLSDNSSTKEKNENDEKEKEENEVNEKEKEENTGSGNDSEKTSSNNSAENITIVNTTEEKSLSEFPPIKEAVRSLSLLKDILEENDKSLSENEDDEDEIEFNENNMVDVNKVNFTEDIIKTECTNQVENINNDNANFEIISNTNKSDLFFPPADSTLSQWLSGNLNKSSNNNGSNNINNEINKHISLKENNGNSEEIVNTNNNNSDNLIESIIDKNNNNEKLESINNNNIENNVNNSTNNGNINNNNNSNNEINNSNNEENITHGLTKKIIENGWDKNSTDITIGELYLLLKKPEKIILEYDWEEVIDNSYNIEGNNLEKNCENLLTSQSEKNEKNLTSELNSNCESVLNKLLTAAKITLLTVNNKSKLNLKHTTRKNKRLKFSSPLSEPPVQFNFNNNNNVKMSSPPASSTSSSLLSSVISNTILTDSSDIVKNEINLNLTDGNEKEFNSNNMIGGKCNNSNNNNLSNKCAMDIITSSSSNSSLTSNSLSSISSTTREQQQFVIPNLPSKMNNLKLLKSNTKEVDPILVQEALKQLNTNKLTLKKHPRKVSTIFNGSGVQQGGRSIKVSNPVLLMNKQVNSSSLSSSSPCLPLSSSCSQSILSSCSSNLTSFTHFLPLPTSSPCLIETSSSPPLSSTLPISSSTPSDSFLPLSNSIITENVLLSESLVNNPVISSVDINDTSYL